MSGPLRRLAKGLAGEPPVRIHTRARLPFAPAPEILPLHPAHDSTGPAVAEGQAETAAPLPATPSARLGDEGPTPPPTGVDEPIAAPGPQGPVQLPATPLPGLRQADRRPGPSSAADGTGAPEVPPVAADAGIRHHRDAPGAPAVQGGMTPGDGRDPPPTAAQDQETGRRSNGRPATPSRAPRPGRPVTEMPQAVVRARAERIDAQDATAGLGDRPSAPPPPEPTEVHVHIGRIEVTAVSEAKTPRRAPARSARTPMSLDEYLGKRDKRR